MAAKRMAPLQLGGARPGAGRKPADYVPSEDRLDYEAARARNESAKADLNELELAIKRGDSMRHKASMVRRSSGDVMADDQNIAASHVQPPGPHTAEQAIQP